MILIDFKYTNLYNLKSKVDKLDVNEYYLFLLI